MATYPMFPNFKKRWTKKNRSGVMLSHIKKWCHSLGGQSARDKETIKEHGKNADPSRSGKLFG